MINTNDAYIVYHLYIWCDEIWQSAYIGHCAASEYSRLPDANRNSEVAIKISSTDHIQTTFIGVYHTEAEATAAKEALFAAMVNKPPCNANGTIILRGKRGHMTPIRNTTLNVTYPSMKAAAKALDVSLTAISKHVDGHMPTVRGCVLERLS